MRHCPEPSAEPRVSACHAASFQATASFQAHIHPHSIQLNHALSQKQPDGLRKLSRSTTFFSKETFFHRNIRRQSDYTSYKNPESICWPVFYSEFFLYHANRSIRCMLILVFAPATARNKLSTEGRKPSFHRITIFSLGFPLPDSSRANIRKAHRKERAP